MTNLVRLMRVSYPTDRDDVTDPDYWGAFSDPFPRPEPPRQIVGVDWSTPGEVAVTYLVPSIGGRLELDHVDVSDVALDGMVRPACSCGGLNWGGYTTATIAGRVWREHTGTVPQ